METTRTITHDNTHTDIEKLFIVDGVEVWAVIECNCFIETLAHEFRIVNAEWVVKVLSDS